MQITRENIGDTLCLYQSAEHIRILDVNSRFVFYAKENGSHYAGAFRSADAFPVTDPSRLALFERNYNLGKALNAAEMKAIERLSTGYENEHSEANKVLSAVRAQLKHLFSRMTAERATTEPGTKLATQFLSRLAEQPTGSHDTFWGHKVQLLSNWSYDIQIDEKTMDFSSAVAFLSKVRFAEPRRKPALSDTINAANLRKGTISITPELELIPER